ncbi:hypothetical protein BC941DRAFT_456081 [Chlamydoabsidia padenii]|nr:hypothetical protein BC941DRAFT_456081 [Chlamydoabsidia padenii]
MTQRQLTQSLDDMFDVKGPDVDPAAAQWHNWAAKTSKQSVKDLNLSLFPFDSILKQQSRSSQTNSPSSVSPSQSSQRPSSSSPSSPSTQQQQQDDHAKEVVVDKRPAFMNNTIQHLFTDPPHCFCRQVASRSETDAFGVTYDCHLMTTDTPSTTGICGFHIHHDAWRAIGDMIRKDQLVDPNDPELSTCPWFNFTFCVTFSLSNTYKKQSPRGPNCFCQRQVELGFDKIYLVYNV